MHGLAAQSWYPACCGGVVHVAVAALAAQLRGWSSASALDTRHARSRATHLVVLAADVVVVVTLLRKGRELLRLG